MQPHEGDEAEFRPDQSIAAVPERELAFELVAGEGELTDHGGYGDRAEELVVGLLEELLADYLFDFVESARKLGKCISSANIITAEAF